MQILISICYPDGSPPDCQGRNCALDYGEDAEDILQQWLDNNKGEIHFPSGWMTCSLLEVEDGNDEQYGGQYVHLTVKEEAFEKVPDFVARLH
jgi:hypothetical protein